MLLGTQAALLNHLRHTAITELYGLVGDAQPFMLAMEPLQQGRLDNFLPDGKIDSTIVRKLALDVCEALIFLSQYATRAIAAGGRLLTRHSLPVSAMIAMLLNPFVPPCPCRHRRQPCLCLQAGLRALGRGRSQRVPDRGLQGKTWLFWATTGAAGVVMAFRGLAWLVRTCGPIVVFVIL